MMGRARHFSVDTVAVEVLDIVDHDGRVVDGINLDAGQSTRILSRKTLGLSVLRLMMDASIKEANLRQVVYVELNVHYHQQGD